MYQDHYGLIEKPFSLTPDPKFFFGQAGHAEARDLLRYGIREREGFMCFIGAAGTGKTTMLRTALEGLGNDVVTAMIFNPQITEEDLLRTILVEFGIIPQMQLDSDVARQLGKQEMLEYLNGFLLELSMRGRTAVLVIDEAQTVPLPIMEQIRLLSNLETNKQKLLQIVLVGQPGLRRLLETPELSQLAQRVSVRYTIEPLEVGDIALYVGHRLRVAGNCGEVSFEHAACERIHRYSEGVPRLVNLLADRALLAGYAQQQPIITAAMVEEAAVTLELVGQNGPPVKRASLVASAPQPVSAARDYSGFRPWQAAVGVAMAAIVTVGGYASWQRQQVPQLRAPVEVRAEGSSEHFGGSATELELARPQAAFTVYLSSHRNTTDAALVSLLRQIETAGYRSFLVAATAAGQGTLYRLTVGEYADRSTAANAAAALRDALGLAHAEAVAVADVDRS